MPKITHVKRSRFQDESGKWGPNRRPSRLEWVVEDIVSLGVFWALAVGGLTALGVRIATFDSAVFEQRVSTQSNDTPREQTGTPQQTSTLAISASPSANTNVGETTRAALINNHQRAR